VNETAGGYRNAFSASSVTCAAFLDAADPGGGNADSATPIPAVPARASVKTQSQRSRTRTCISRIAYRNCFEAAHRRRFRASFTKSQKFPQRRGGDGTQPRVSRCSNLYPVIADFTVPHGDDRKPCFKVSQPLVGSRKLMYQGHRSISRSALARRTHRRQSFWRTIHLDPMSLRERVRILRRVCERKKIAPTRPGMVPLT